MVTLPHPRQTSGCTGGQTELGSDSPVEALHQYVLYDSLLCLPLQPMLFLLHGQQQAEEVGSIHSAVSNSPGCMEMLAQ